MRKLIITQNITIDGSVEFLGDWFDPQEQDDELIAEMQKQDARTDAVLLGRRTFEDFRGYWPDKSDDTTGTTDYLNTVQKYVVSSTITDPLWANSTVLKGDPIGTVADLKNQAGAEIVLTGSIRLAHTLIAAGLVDEFRLFVYPVVQGRGRRLFPDGYELTSVARAEPAVSFSSGITLVNYRVQ